MAKEKRAASMRPSDHTETTGLWQGRGTIVDAEFITVEQAENYGSGVPAGTPLANITVEAADGQEVSPIYLSCGNAKDWEPNKDGSELVAIGSIQQLNLSCNLSLFNASLVNAGYPEDKMGSNIKDMLIGLDAEFARVPAPTRQGLKPKAGQEGREKTIITITDIYKLPWEKKGGGGKDKAKAGASKAKPKENAGGDDDTESTAIAAILAILGSEGTIAKNKLPKLLMDQLKADGITDVKEMRPVLQLAQSDDFLSSAGVFTYEDGELSPL